MRGMRAAPETEQGEGVYLESMSLRCEDVRSSHNHWELFCVSPMLL